MALKNTYFGQGAGRAHRVKGSDVITIWWNGKADGYARHIPHVNRYTREGNEYPSFKALLRAIEAEHAIARDAARERDRVAIEQARQAQTP